MDDLEEARKLMFGAAQQPVPQDDGLNAARALVFGAAQPQPQTPTGVVGDRWYQNIMPAIGMGMTDLALGAKQLVNDQFVKDKQRTVGGDWVYKTLGFDPEKRQQELRQQVQEKRALDKPLADAPGGTMGAIVGRAAPAIPLSVLPGGGTLGGSMLVGGLSSAAEPVLEGESRTKNAALGAAGGGVGYGIGKLIGKVVSPAIRPQDKAVTDLVQSGVPVRLDQATNSNVVKNIAAAMDNMPFTAGVRQAQKESQRQGLNQAVARTMGSDANKLTDEAMGVIRDQLGGKFTQLSAKNTLTDTPTLVKGLIDFQNNTLPKLPKDVQGAAQSHVSDILQKIDPTSGTIPGGVYRALDSAIGRSSRGTSNGDLRNALGDIRQVLRNSMDNSISAADSAAWKEVRKQYANMMAASSARNAEGDVLPRALYQKAAQGNSSVKFGGGGDLAKIARAAREVVPDPIPNSGTAQRALYQNLLQYGTLGGAGAGYGAATGQDPWTTAGYALGAGALGNAGARAIGADISSRYLGNELMPEMLKQLLAQSGGLLGGSMTRPYPN